MARARRDRGHARNERGLCSPNLPLSFETAIAETNPITILRVSPLDAHEPANVSHALKGSGLNHFAAFTDSSWRRHDIAWGRLNAAEILIRNLLPSDEPAADQLIAEAHGIIETHYAKSAETTTSSADNTTKKDSLGQPLLANVAITDKPQLATLLRRGGGIASKTAKDLLERTGHPTPATVVEVATDAAQDVPFSKTIMAVYRLLPTMAKIAIWVAATLVLTLAVLLPIVRYPIIIGAILGVIVSILFGAALVSLLLIWFLRQRIRTLVDRLVRTQ